MFLLSIIMASRTKFLTLPVIRGIEIIYARRRRNGCTVLRHLSRSRRNERKHHKPSSRNRACARIADESIGSLRSHSYPAQSSSLMTKSIHTR
jgi:hypothetical protein